MNSLYQNTKLYSSFVGDRVKDIFNRQRSQPGHEINSYLNHRFHKLKKKHDFKIVADLVQYDIVTIVNNFKGEVIQKKIKIFT